ncbi:MAG: PD-(D/E)XK nuclease domain-containing protein [Lachnospiraceae bacterium]|nr:PD-(D/E)XK nuclease domain-containing protein [Lachnospiraceae bacterium]
MVVELKWNKKCETALDQIREKKYVEALKGYKGEVILVGISYEKRSENKEHACKIDRVVLEN